MFKYKKSIVVMDAGNHSKNRASSKSRLNMKRAGWKFVPLLALWLLSLNTYGAYHPVTFKGNIPDTVYIVLYDRIWYTKLPVTVTVFFVNKTNSFKIYAENYAVKKIDVKKNKKYKIELEKIDRSDEQSFAFWNELFNLCLSGGFSRFMGINGIEPTEVQEKNAYTLCQKILSFSNFMNDNEKYRYSVKMFQKYAGCFGVKSEYAFRLFQKTWSFSNSIDNNEKKLDLENMIKTFCFYERADDFIVRMFDYIGLTNDKRADIWFSLGNHSENYSNGDFIENSIRYYSKWYELSGISSEEYFNFLLEKGESFLTFTNQSTAMKSERINAAIRFFEDAKSLYPTNDLTKEYISYAKKLRQENDNVMQQETAEARRQEEARQQEEAQRLAELKAERERKQAEDWQKLEEYVQDYVNYRNSRNSSGNSSNSSGSSTDAGNSNTGSGSTGSGSSSRNTNTSTGRTQTSDCGVAWRTDSRTYSDHDTELRKMKSKSYPYNDADVLKNAMRNDKSSRQSAMKSIRKKWTDRGCIITKSEMEDW